MNHNSVLIFDYNFYGWSFSSEIYKYIRGASCQDRSNAYETWIERQHLNYLHAYNSVVFVFVLIFDESNSTDIVHWLIDICAFLWLLGDYVTIFSIV